MRPTMRRQVPASSLGSAEEYTPGLSMECEMNDVPSTTTSSHSVMWPVRPALPPSMQRLPTTLLPAMATQAASAECAPMRHVVRDHDEVVELDAFFDDRVVERAAVDGGVGADLDVVADVHAADLRHLDPGALLGRVAETVAADHRAGLHDAAPAEHHVVPDEYARHEARIVADVGAALDDASRGR